MVAGLVSPIPTFDRVWIPTSVLTQYPGAPPEGVAQVLSPLRKVELLAVPDPSLAVGTVPEYKLDAFKAVNPIPDP